MVARIAAMATYIGQTKSASGTAIEPHLDEMAMGKLVADEVLCKIPIDRSSITMVIFASAGIRPIFPSGAASITAHLGLNCKSFDVLAGCGGFGQAIEIASLMDGSILVVTADTLSRTVSPNEPSHEPLKLFADGAAAVLISHDALAGHRIINAFGETQPFCHSYYGASQGLVKRSLPPTLKPKLRDAYLNAWLSITRELINQITVKERPWVYCNQGDHQLFVPFMEEIKKDVQRIILTGHGHAGGADPWIGLMNHPLEQGQHAIMLASGIGFHFHGLLLEIGQCRV
ncbi:hypothetical protein KP803_11870 [Vibrio sp. ZSDE26]|uniref:Beta-ketoacyl-[acyl-carrier-protein] synthase III N-terminal domain-containing protein n=1 Tax=Vibrio amylolyticus TaxID=2847292 RepID=A0A9X1XLL2_9VIBR|nr:hypothetical protein [Vibrio amylolyticus]MCK6263968.1 hypothetical protein [Vibrio amylolyticus]